MLIRSILLVITGITLVAVQAEAAWWDGFADNGLDARVRALVEYNGELIIGGDFANAGTTPANFIAAWDGAMWSALGVGVNDDIHALTVYNGELIAAGKFHTAGGVAANHIAAWDGTSWSALGDGVDDVVLPVSFTPYYVSIDWWYLDEDDNTTYPSVEVSTPGQLETLHY